MSTQKTIIDTAINTVTIQGGIGLPETLPIPAPPSVEIFLRVAGFIVGCIPLIMQLIDRIKGTRNKAESEEKKEVQNDVK